jgi:AcrR family transcriptional regulator
MSTEKRPYRLKARGDQQQATRLRIIKATAGLHDEIGPARTTVSEIARRAGVQRLTVYNHFPNEADLLDACGAHWMTEHPLPDMSAAIAEPDAAERLRRVLTALYGWYRENKTSTEHLQRDRLLMPALDGLMSIRMDQEMAALADLLAAGFTGADQPAEVRATVALALDFWSWRRLSHEGMTDEGVATIMTAAAKAVSEGR